MKELYVNNNGAILPNKGATIAAGNRSYLYGDGLFESVRIMNGKPNNLENHYNRLVQGAKAIKMRFPFFLRCNFLKIK